MRVSTGEPERVSEGKVRIEGQVYNVILCPRCLVKASVKKTSTSIRDYYCTRCDHEFRVPVAYPKVVG